MDSLIHSESTLLIWMVVISVVALALTLEKKFTWAAKISATMICLFAGLALANVGLFHLSLLYIRILPVFFYHFQSPYYCYNVT
ncbi:hypothetical protein JCM19046_2948 [Bacillus sp. JCM 19046]|nr:hypothetical protein JCM19046_2948 [Bacillus sp. JCM 19046]